MGRLPRYLGIGIISLIFFCTPLPAAAYDQQLLTSPAYLSIPKMFRYMLLVATPTTSPSLAPLHKKTTSNLSDMKQSPIMTAINQYRKEKGLPAVTMNAATCAFARTRATEITKTFSHSGFDARIAAGTLPYTHYSLVTENIAQTSDFRRVVPMWINSPGHAKNMREDTPFVCVESSGNFFTYEGWKP